MDESLTELVKRIREDRHLILSGEEAIRQGVILPILARLGWDRDNIRQVVPEFAVGSGRVDYCLKIGDRNAVFVEAKRTNQDLDRHQEQLPDYAFREGVETAVLTNGLLWWLYLALLSGSWEQRKFFTINLEQQEPETAAEHFWEFLARDRIADGSAVERARAVQSSREKERLIQRTIPKAWSQICQGPDELLLEIFAEKVAGLCGHKPDHSMLAEYLASFIASLVAPAPLPQTPPPMSSSPPAARRPATQPSASAESAVNYVYTYKRPVAFVFLGQRYNVTTFKDILMGLCEALVRLHPNEFEKVTTLRDRKRAYFSRNFQGMTAPAEIDHSGIYAETNLSANNMIDRCHEMLAVLGYSQDELKTQDRG